MKKIARLEYKGSFRTLNTHLASGANYITDAPTDNHGKGEAFSPTDLIASGLADCIITIIGIEAQKIGVEIHGASAEIYKEMQAAPRRIAGIGVELEISSNANEAQRQRLEERGRNCPVALSLHPDLQQKVIINWED